MPRTELRPGTVIRYPYLWRWQHARGEDAGRKVRPVCVVVALRGTSDGLTHLVLLAISSRPATADQVALEIPETERRRAGLDEEGAAWVTISEFNYDIAEASHHLDLRAPPLGRFSRSFMMRLAAAFAPTLRKGRARIDRAE